MREVKRWTHHTTWDGSLQIQATMMALREDGDYVLASDYDALAAELAALKGQEPVAYLLADAVGGSMLEFQTSHLLEYQMRYGGRIEPLYASPPPSAQGAWIPVSERLPESGHAVLAYYLNSHGKGRRIRAQHVMAWTIEAGDVCDPDTECVEYSEQDDTYYLLEGWYECIDNWDDYAIISVNEGPITHWMPLPDAPHSGVKS